VKDISLSTLYVTLAILLVVSAFFSISETSMMALNRYRLKHLTQSGQRGAQLVSDLLAKTDKFLGVVLLGNNLANAASALLVGLIAERYLLTEAPQKGTALLTGEFRTPRGNDLLLYAKDFLFALLFGDEAANIQLQRTQRELLTLTLPREKAEALDFMKATTELSAFGTWQDPERVSNDQRADNVLLEVEFGEIEGELVGDGIVRALSLINSLEINEQILYARMINVEQTTLIT